MVTSWNNDSSTHAQVDMQVQDTCFAARMCLGSCSSKIERLTCIPTTLLYVWTLLRAIKQIASQFNLTNELNVSLNGLVMEAKQLKSTQARESADRAIKELKAFISQLSEEPSPGVVHIPASMCIAVLLLALHTYLKAPRLVILSTNTKYTSAACCTSSAAHESSLLSLCLHCRSNLFCTSSISPSLASASHNVL